MAFIFCGLVLTGVADFSGVVALSGTLLAVGVATVEAVGSGVEIVVSGAGALAGFNSA